MTRGTESLDLCPKPRGQDAAVATTGSGEGWTALPVPSNRGG